jgi:asparagine synthetase B (glutamine-hydrolysing)
MCGICVFFRYPDVEAFKPMALQYAKRIRHRGPDWSKFRLSCIFAFLERTASAISSGSSNEHN